MTATEGDQENTALAKNDSQDGTAIAATVNYKVGRKTRIVGPIISSDGIR